MILIDTFLLQWDRQTEVTTVQSVCDGCKEYQHVHQMLPGAQNPESATQQELFHGTRTVSLEQLHQSKQGFDHLASFRV